MSRTRSRQPNRRAVRVGLVACLLTALAVTTGVVWQSAYSNFGDTAPKISTALNTGNVVLADDDAEATLFSVGRLKPGATGTRCIKVSTTGATPTTVRLYGTGRSVTNGLDDALQLTVRIGTGGSTSSCTGFTTTATVYSGALSGFTAGDFAAGLGSWSATSSANRTYQFTYLLSATAPASAQGGSATLTFVWEAQTR
jgi:hypothetical protein